MKQIFSTLLTLLFFYAVSFSQQNDCGNNAGFELGNTNGWILKTGWYGAYGAGYSQANCPPTGTCPTPAPLFSTAYPGGAIPAATPLNGSLTGNIHQSLVNAAGGMDPNSNNTVPMLCPTGGNYSLRLGNNATAQLGYASGSDAEAARFTFNVSTSNAGFTYQYAFFVQSPGHAFESEPSFEVVVLDQNDSLIPCGRYFVTGPPQPAVAANCINTGNFQNGPAGSQYIFQAWTSVGLDLTGYIGQNVSIEFRTHDCLPSGGGSSGSTCNGSCCTVTANGSSCTYCSPSPACTPTASACGYAPGTHSAYAYIDCYCTPLTIAAPTFCAGAASIQICAPAGYTSYSWPAGQPGITGSPATQCVTVNNPVSGNTYTVNMISATGCPTKTTVKLQGATPTVNSPTICAGQPTTLMATGGTGSYTWSTGSNNTSIVVSPTVTTTYTVTTVATGTVNCPSSATATVTVGSIAATVSPPTTICPGSSATLTTTGGGTYSWSTGATNPSITVSPGSTTTYSVLVTNGLCQESGTTTVTVAPVVATVSAPTSICLGSSTSFTASGGTTYSWSNGQITPSITVTPTASATYSVIVFNSAGCSDTASTSVTVNSVSPTLSPSSTICTGASVPLTAGGGTTYLWSPGGATTPSITVTPNATQIYSVTVSNGNCSTTVSDTVTVATSITAHINNPPAICAGASATLIASGGSNYSWTPGGQTTPTIIVSPAATTTYSVIVSSGLCPADTASATIIINPIPAANYSNSIVCFNNPTVFTDMSTPAGGLIYSWSFGNTTTSNLQNPSLIFNAAGTYPVKLVVKTTAGGCVDSITKMVVINPLPVANFSSTPVCAGNPVCFKDASTIPTGTNTGWSWNFGDASPNSTQQNPCHTYSSAGTFSVTLTVTSDSGCQSTTVLPALVNPKPTANFTSTSPCLNASTALKDASTDVSLTDPITTWNWTMPGGNPTTAATQNTSTIYNTTGTHTITLIVTSKAGCSDTIAQPVTVYNPPVPNFSGSGDGCAPLCVNNYTDLSTSVDGTISGWLWTFPGGTPSISTAQNPGSICYKDSGAYGASLVVTTSFGCTDSITITPLINVRPWPKADFCVTPTQAPATDPTFNFCDLWTPNPGVVSWVWNFGDGSEDSTSLNPIHTYTAVTTNDFYFYTVKLIVRNQFGCWDTISKEVELIPEFTFYIPNSFTPNGDNFNDMFFGKGRGIKDYNIWLFDRWGNEIWDCSYSGKNTDWDGPNQDGMPSACKWDGTVIAGNPGITGGSGKQVQQDVYVWKVKLTDVFDKNHTYIGQVTVIK